MGDGPTTCALCPRLCRHACPVALGTAREAAVPAVIAGVLVRHARGQVDDATALAAASLCVDCGRCQDACHLHEPLPQTLQQVRAQLAPTVPPVPVGVVEGTGALVAVEHDDRRWAAALATRLGEPVAVLRTPDALGAEARGAPGWARHTRAVARAVGRHVPVVADGRIADVLADAEVAFRWLDEVAGLEATPSCRAGAAACCGGAGPLASHHPLDAARMAGRFPVGDTVADGRCAQHLHTCGIVVTDAIDRLLEGA